MTIESSATNDTSTGAPEPCGRAHLLRGRCAGAVHLPGDAAYDEARMPWNVAVDQRPAAVAYPGSADEVSDIVRAAAACGLKVAPQRTGHNAEPLGSLDSTILVKTDALQEVSIDRERKVARVGGGVKWGAVVPQASDMGLAALHGSTPDVSVAGYSLGGGVGWYARKLGLSTNSVTAIELVTADGTLRRVDADTEPDLFWALRGGGGNFGIVTAIEVQLYSIPDIYAGVLFFSLDRASEVLHAWRDWTETVPDEVTSVGRILQFPPIPEVPEPMRGKAFAIVEAVYMGDEASGRELLKPIRDLGPAMDTFAMVEPVGLAELHMDPPNPVPYTGAGHMLGHLDAAGIDRFVEVAVGSPLISSEIRHVGGQLSRPKPGNGALNTFDAEYLTFGVGAVMDLAGYRAQRAAIDAHARAFEPYLNGREYLNFTEHQTDPANFYSPTAYRRLREVKRNYDPRNVIRANHAITPA